MTVESLLLLAGAVMLFAFKPGPCMFTSMSYSASHGFTGLVACVSGFSIGLVIYLSIVFFGLMTVGNFNLDMVVFAILAKSFAAIYLIMLGLKDLKEWDAALNPKEVEIDKPKDFVDMMSSVVLLTISNPLVIVFYASIIPAFINPEVITVQVAILVAVMLILIDSFGMAVYCMPVILFRKALPEKFTKYTKLVSGIVIILIGLYIGYTAIPADDLKSVF